MRENNIAKLIVIIPIVFIIITTTIVIAILIESRYKQFKSYVEIQKKSYILEAKNKIKKRVEHIGNFVEHKESKINTNIKNILKTKIENGYKVVDDIYQKYGENSTKEEMIGKRVDSLCIKSIISKLDTNKSSFIKHKNAKNELEKMSYYKYHKELDIFLCMSRDKNSCREKIKKDIVCWINSMSYPKNFVSLIDLKSSTKDDFFRNITTIENKKIDFKEIVELTKSNNSSYFKKYQNLKEILIYAKYYEKWDLIFYSFIDVSNVKEYLKETLQKEECKIKKELIKSTLFVVVIILLLTTILMMIMERINQIIETNNFNLKQLNHNLEEQVKAKVDEIREKDRIIIQQSKLASMGEMIGNIAHQWRQPLNAFGLIIQKIKHLYTHDKLTKEKIDKINDDAITLLKKMSTTIDDFRNFFAPNKLEERFDLVQNIKDSLRFIEPTLKNNNISVLVEASQEKLIVKGFPSEFSQVVANLLNNSKEAIVNSKNQKGLITILIYQQKYHYIVEIIDNGGGIKDENIDKIFEPYFSTKEGEGRGIGLYMSKMIIEKSMKGKLSVENFENGTKFIIKLLSKREK